MAAALSGVDAGPVNAAGAELLWRSRPALRSALSNAHDCLARTLRHPKLPFGEKRECQRTSAEIERALAELDRAEAAKATPDRGSVGSG